MINILNHSIVKNPLYQGFFSKDLSKATPSELKILNYLFKFLLYRHEIFCSNSMIAKNLQVSVRTVIRCLQKYRFLFLRQDRYGVRAGKRVQLSCRMRLSSWVMNVEVLRYLAHTIKAIRQFPSLLLFGVFSLSMLVSSFVPSGLSMSSLFNRVMSHKNNKDLFINPNPNNHTKNNFEGGSVQRGGGVGMRGDGGVGLKKRIGMEHKLPEDVVFNVVQQAQWDAAGAAAQQKALSELAKSRTSITSKGAWLLKVADKAKQEQQAKQEPVRQKRQLPPREERAKDISSYHDLENIEREIRIKGNYLKLSTIDQRERPYHEEKLEVLKLARLYRLQTEQPKDQVEQPITPAQKDMAMYLVQVMPASAKEDALLAKAQGDPMTKNNPVLDYILKDYLQKKRDALKIT